MVKNLTIVVPFYNGHRYIARLIDSLPDHIPILVVDDRSDTPLHSNQIYRRDKPIQVVRLEKKGYFAGAVNYALKHTTTDVLVLNQDTWFENHYWCGVIEQYRDRFAFVGERIQGQHPSFGEIGYIHGTFMFMRRDAIRQVGLLNEELYPLWGNTAEWQWRVVRKGFEALPLHEIPGFRHERKSKERFGSSIQTLLDQEPEKKDLLVRTPPLLSVVVPCYNYGRYLQDCINSLIGGPTILGNMPGQTLQSFEIVVVNDASTDNSAEIIDSLSDIRKGIRVYHLNQNVGTAQALNYGIDKAVGKYITFLSADDMREPDSLKNLVRVCDNNPHAFAYDDIWIFHKHQRIKKWKMEEYDFEKLLYKNHIHAGIVFPKAAWEEVGGYPAIMSDGREDWAFNVALGISGWCGLHVPQYGYLYRREGQNRTETNTTPWHRERFLQKIQSLFPEIYGGYRPMACCGKGRNSAKTTINTLAMKAMTQNGGLMSANISGGMVRLRYLGKKMSSIWTGMATGTEYVFGLDRQTGWVYTQDVGERGKSGLLNYKDSNGQWLFEQVSANTSTKTTEPVQVSEPVAETKEAIVETENVATTEVDATAAQENVVTVPDPTDLNVEEIKRLQLDKAGWTEVYKIELAGRNRKGAITFIEEQIASFD